MTIRHEEILGRISRYGQNFKIAQSLRDTIEKGHLFCNKFGKPYIKEDGTYSGTNSIWDRAMKAALTDKAISKRFTENDLRGKAGSDTGSIDKAQKLLRHTTPQTTKANYFSGAELIDSRK